MRSFKYIFIIFFVVLSISAIGQNSIVRFIKKVPTNSFNSTSDSVISYPIFLFENKVLTTNVNTAVKDEFYKLHELDKSLPIRKVLDSLSSEGLSELSYEELTNDNKFFTFLIYSEWVAAYPTYNNSYFAFDKQTGQRLTIDSLILFKKQNSFNNLIISLLKNSLAKYRQELLIQLENQDIDSTDYQLVLKYTDSCVNSYYAKNFKLENDTLEIYFKCSFPRIVRPIEPSASIKLPFQAIRSFLKPKYRK